MTGEVAEAAEALIAVLARENAALLALDVTSAGALLAEKTRSADRLAAALRAVPAAPDRAMRGLGLRLRDLTEQNRRLLERAIAAQGRVLDIIARALPQAAALPARYGASGSLTQPPRLGAMTLSARA